MSNESENRIDLTQFEGMTKGPWEFPPLSGLMLVTAYPHPLIVKQENGEGNCRLQLGKINSNYDGAAIAKLPDLIAELKRMYESEDRLLELLQVIEYKYDIPVKQIAGSMSI